MVLPIHAAVSSDSELGLFESDTWKHLLVTQWLLSHTHKQNWPRVTRMLQKAPLQCNVLRWEDPLGSSCSHRLFSLSSTYSLSKN